MYNPELKRCRTIGIRYTYGVREDEHYEKIIEEILSVPEDEVEGLDERGDKQLMIKFTTDERYNFIVDNFTYRNITIAPGTVVQVEDISTYRQRVLVRDVPFEVTNDVLKALMEDYGEVTKIE